MCGAALVLGACGGNKVSEPTDATDGAADAGLTDDAGRADAGAPDAGALDAGFDVVQTSEGLLRGNWKTHLGVRDSVILAKLADA